MSFEQAKFETMLPQPAGNSIQNLGQLKETVESMKSLDGFLEGIKAQEEDKEGGHDSEEG